jgi:hypothetical protein
MSPPASLCRGTLMPEVQQFHAGTGRGDATRPSEVCGGDAGAVAKAFAASLSVSGRPSVFARGAISLAHTDALPLREACAGAEQAKKTRRSILMRACAAACNGQTRCYLEWRSETGFLDG